MPEFYVSANSFVQMVIRVGAISTLLIFIQIIMLLIGFGEFSINTDIGDLDGDGLFDIAGLKLISVRGVLIFLASASWTYLLVYSYGGSHTISLVIGIIVGIIAMGLFAYAMKKMLDLQEDGTVDIHNSIGKVGTVYLKIPSNRSGKGKVNVLIQERFAEFDAITEEINEISTGTEVEILKVVNNILVVKEFDITKTGVKV